MQSSAYAIETRCPGKTQDELRAILARDYVTVIAKSSQTVKFYSSPDLKGKPEFEVGNSYHISVNRNDLRNPGKNALETFDFAESMGKLFCYTSWIHRDDVILKEIAFKKVTGCWPIKRLELRFPDGGAVWDFDSTGKGKTETLDAERKWRKAESYVYIYGDLFEIRNYIDGKHDTSQWGKLDLKTGQVVEAAEEIEQTNFTREQLKSCFVDGMIQIKTDGVVTGVKWDGGIKL